MAPPTWADWIAFGAIVVGIFNSWKLTKVHVSLDGRFNQMIKIAKAQGRQDERDDRNRDERSRNKASNENSV